MGKKEKLFIKRVLEIGLVKNCVRRKKRLKEVCKCIGLKAFCLLLHIC